jgi:outer membrane protein
METKIKQMKKFLVVSTLCVGLASISNTATAQAQPIRIGVFDADGVLSLMPGIGKVDTTLRRYVQDSLNPRRDYILSELKRKDSTYRADSAKLAPQVREIMQKDIAQDYYTIQNWQQIQQEAVQAKQQELTAPFYEKIYSTLQEIVQDQKYTHVFKDNVFVMPIPLTDNLSIKVAQRLKLKLPKEVEEALKAQGLSVGTGPSAAPAPKPMVPTRKK